MTYSGNKPSLRMSEEPNSEDDASRIFVVKMHACNHRLPTPAWQTAFSADKKTSKGMPNGGSDQ
jgi:hypothetical protein